MLRRCREIKKPVAARAAFLVDLIQTFRETFVAGLIVEFALMIEERLRKSFPDIFAHFLREYCLRRFLQLLSEFVVVFGRRAKPTTVTAGGNSPSAAML